MKNNNKPTTIEHHCWICESKHLEIFRPSQIEKVLQSNSFAISDNNYGVTGELHRCQECGFLQCSDFTDILHYYEDLQDKSYESGRELRALQAVKILDVIHKIKQDGNLLDIGAASGILVEQAIKMGYQAVGVEPSKWLQSIAQEHGLPVHLGTFPHPDITGKYDIITLVDVIEHVPEPVKIIANLHENLSDDGIILVVTPNIDSFLARLLGRNWWHFRIAHIGYFNKKTINLAFKNNGFDFLLHTRPGWYFSGDYLVDRVNMYLPRVLHIPQLPFLKKITIPLNLGDSILGIYSNTPKTRRSN